MAKKESLNKSDKTQGDDLQPQASARPGKINFISQKTFSIIKFVLGIFLLPFVYSSSVAFINELSVIKGALQSYFWSGVITYLVIYLFVCEPTIIYLRGQKLLEFIFSFFKPLVRIAPYLLPVYTIVLFFVYIIGSLIIESRLFLDYTVFLFGFTMALHLVFGAKSLRSRKGDLLKGNYIFGFSFMYILNLFLVSLFFSFIFNRFSIVNFTNNSFNTAAGVFSAIFKQLFLS